MARFRMLLVAGVVAAAILAPGSAQGGAQATKLTATVGPGFTISLKMGGKTVRNLKRGTYTIVVTDKADDHNFHLKGPGVNKEITTTPFRGTKTYTVTLKKGKYTYVCDPHADGMKGSFTVK